MPQRREVKQDRPQVRLDPDVAEWVAECAEDYEVSLTIATNKLLRALRDEPVGAPPPIPVESAAANEPAIAREPQAPIPRALLRRGVNPRAATILAWNRDGDV